MLSTANFVQESMKMRPSKKLGEKYIGPFEIVKMISPVAAKLNLPETMKIHPVFHISLLKKYNRRPEGLRQDEEIPVPPIMIADHEEFEVEEILDKKVTKRGRGQSIRYLIKWKGYPLSDATWEPIQNLQNAQEVLQEFEQARSLKEGRM